MYENALVSCPDCDSQIQYWAREAIPKRQKNRKKMENLMKFAINHAQSQCSFCINPPKPQVKNSYGFL